MVTAYLTELKISRAPIYYRMPVPGGYGKSGLDYEGCVCGLFFAIETKSPDEDADLTQPQRDAALAMWKGGGKVFIISNIEGLNAFKRWVEQCIKAA